MRYKAYSLYNYLEIPEISNLDKEILFNIRVVASVLPFKVNNYVIENLIDWSHPLEDPVFHIVFPSREMLKPDDFNAIAELIKRNAPPLQIKKKADLIREKLNPHPAGQQDANIPVVDGKKLRGIQHKYKETVLFFPSQGQTCHAYCSFCFRWPQFVGNRRYKFSESRINNLLNYLMSKPDVTDLLITGGDPLIMKTSLVQLLINKILKLDHPNLKNIRIGTKTLSYWPYRFLTDNDSDNLLKLFEKVNNSNKTIAIMTHFNHYKELESPVVEKAVKRIKQTGSIIRTQAPLLNHINNDPKVWQKMWNKQVKMGMIPYYFFIARNTGAQHYFCVPLFDAYNLYKTAYSNVSGLSRTVRGPVMSCNPGKMQILGINKINNEDVFVLRFIQARNPQWTRELFYAKLDKKAIWRTQLKPAFGKEKFFYEH